MFVPRLFNYTYMKEIIIAYRYKNQTLNEIIWGWTKNYVNKYKHLPVPNQDEREESQWRRNQSFLTSINLNSIQLIAFFA